MSKIVKCYLCERRFSEIKAIPIRLRCNTFIGKHQVSWPYYVPACPRCVRWDAEAETGVQLDEGGAE